MARSARARSRIGASLIAVSALAAGTAESASPGGQFAVKGLGQSTCKEYLLAREQRGGGYRRYGDYLAGYVTATNRLLPDTVDIASWETIDVLAAYLANACRRKPGARLVEAIEGVLAAIEPERIQQEARLVRVSSGNHSVRLYASVFTRVQRELTERGFYSGPVESKDTPSIRRALRAFQRAHDIDATGVPDQRTLYLLLRPGASEQ